MKEDKTSKITNSSTSTIINNNNNSNNYKHEMWCKIHRSSFHKTKDFVVYVKEKDGEVIRRKEEN
jgi:hypothetical protein